MVDLVNNYGTTNNNGNVLTESYVGGGLTYTQSFSYDSLNRLSTATELSGPTQNWSQTNGYDQYGNRWIDYGGGVHNLSFSSSNNRITTAVFSYDAAGNLTNDTIHAYTFDAENRIKTVDAVTAYGYDGEGHRVRKLVGENTRFVYGMGGQLIAEFNGSTGNLKKEYVYGGATLITIEPTAVNSNGTQYTTSDNLGSPRVITNSSGSVVSRHDFMPFGEELCAGTGGRTTGMGFCAGGDTNRKKFTGYERDTETGLDFAQARYFSSTQGRFTSPDTLLGSLANPQTLNRYAYVGNNPMSFSDPTGHDFLSTGPGSSHFGADVHNPDDRPIGQLPQRYEDEIARIKELIADDEAAGATTKDAESGAGAAGKATDSSGSGNAGSGTITGTVSDPPQNLSDTEPFVVSNPAALENGIVAGQVQYLDANGVAQCARLPLAWQVDQDGRAVSVLNPEVRRGRLTDKWVMGPEVTYGMNLAYGTVLATFIRETGRYGNGEPHTGSHTVVFFRWDTQNGEKGMVVGQQMAGDHGRAVRGFIPFNANNIYYMNANRFNVVLIPRPLRRFTMADKE